MAHELYGLVLAGGRSRRMEEDKAGLVYRDTAQIHRCYNLLSEVCGRAYVSLRDEQAVLADQWNLPRIYDRWEDCGPLGGIVSAMNRFPETAWLVLACDKPFVDRETLQELIKHRSPGCEATAYRIPGRSGPEPLCTIYEPRLLPRLSEAVEAGRLSPRRVLEQSDIHLIGPPEGKDLQDVNTPEEYRGARLILQQQQNDLSR